MYFIQKYILIELNILHIFARNAGVAQLVERQPSKLNVVSYTESQLPSLKPITETSLNL